MFEALSGLPVLIPVLAVLVVAVSPSIHEKVSAQQTETTIDRWFYREEDVLYHPGK